MKKERKIKVQIEYTEGYEKRFTEAYCRMLARRNRGLVPPAVTGAGEKESQYESVQCQKIS